MEADHYGKWIALTLLGGSSLASLCFGQASNDALSIDIRPEKDYISGTSITQFIIHNNSSQAVTAFILCSRGQSPFEIDPGRAPRALEDYVTDAYKGRIANYSGSWEQILSVPA
jgi:hypothetical protein